MSTKWLPGLSCVSDDYEAFVIDQWGVLHDGINLYPEVLRTLEELHSRGKEVVIVTNSRKPLKPNIDRLATLKVNRPLFSKLVSSAAVLREYLVGLRGEGSIGSKYFLVSKAEDKTLLEGTDFQEIASPEEADFVLLLSSEDGSKLEEHLPWIERALEKRLLAFTSSNEPLTINRFGVFDGLSQIIATYQDLGGSVFNAGKPSQLVYETVNASFGEIPARRVLAIGDQFESDIVGAQTMGYDSALVTTGVNVAEFGDGSSTEVALEVASKIANGRPSATWLLPELRWTKAVDATRLPILGIAGE